MDELLRLLQKTDNPEIDLYLNISKGEDGSKTAKNDEIGVLELVCDINGSNEPIKHFIGLLTPDKRSVEFGEPEDLKYFMKDEGNLTGLKPKIAHAYLSKVLGMMAQIDPRISGKESAVQRVKINNVGKNPYDIETLVAMYRRDSGRRGR